MGNCCSRRSRGDDLYAVLGVAPTATRDAIEAGMRRLTDAHGPGRSGRDAKLYDRATKAYAVLLGPQRRPKYDMDLERHAAYVPYSTPETCGSRGGRYPKPEVADYEEFGPNDGFQAANTSTGLWSEPALLSKRIPSDQLTVTKPLSSGEFGDVWLGTLLDGTQVAVKQLKQDQQTAANAVVFATEIVRMTQLNNPKISAFVGVEWTKQWETRAAVEYLPRGDLRTFLGSAFSSPLQQPETEVVGLGWADFKCQVAMDVADALAYLHSGANAGMVSFTSRNVLLEGDDGRCKLSVFAAARVREDELSGAKYLEWLAPEVILGELGSDQRQATIYSLGVLLCELDTMKPPFFDAINPNGSPMSKLKIVQQVALGKLRPSVSPECPEGVASLVSECLSFDPKARPTAASIAYRLRELLKNEL